VWVVTGMWHGASVNFPLWGLLLFVFIALEKFCIGDFLERHGILARLYIWFVIPLTWVVFAISDLKGLGVYFSRLFPFFSEGVAVNASDWMKYGRTYVLFFLLAFIVSLPVVDRLWKKFWDKGWMKVILFALFWFCVYEIANGLNNPFLYFSF
ncbi:MAG: MBOAT family protein, partial [Lachnospiraceae bacterium]|nr:MBOAT family protein [Lachnospiraceae bacterium]